MAGTCVMTAHAGHSVTGMVGQHGEQAVMHGGVCPHAATMSPPSACSPLPAPPSLMHEPAFWATSNTAPYRRMQPGAPPQQARPCAYVGCSQSMAHMLLMGLL